MKGKEIGLDGNKKKKMKLSIKARALRVKKKNIKLMLNVTLIY